MAGNMGFTRDIGPAVIQWGTTEIAEIFEEVRLTLNAEDPAAVTEALRGATPVDHVLMGYSECSVTVPATRILRATLATILPGGSSSGGTSGLVRIKPHLTVGLSMYDGSQPLFIRPIVNGVAETIGTSSGHCMRIEHAYPVPKFDIAFNLKDQRTYAMVFYGHPDATTGILWSAGKVSTTGST